MWLTPNGFYKLISSLAVLKYNRIFLLNSMPNVTTNFKMALNQKATMDFFFFFEEVKFSPDIFTLDFPFY